MPEETRFTVRDDPEASRFEAVDGTGAVAAVAVYQRLEDRVVFVHTEVDDAFEGQGVGSLLVLGFTGGQIPQVKVNRLLLNNVDVRGVGWGAYAMTREGYLRRQWDALLPLVESGVVDPPVGTTYPVAEVSRALVDLEQRRVLGKAVLTFG